MFYSCGRSFKFSFSFLGEIGLIAIGMVVGHISILILDAVLIPVWLNFEKGKEQKDGEIQMESVELRTSE